MKPTNQSAATASHTIAAATEIVLGTHRPQLCVETRHSTQGVRHGGKLCMCDKSPDGSVRTVTDYRLGGQGSIPDMGKGFFSTPQHPDRLWHSASLLSDEYRRLFP
jgi:hypothetical protein